MRPILECSRLTKRYGSFFALSDLNLSLERGQIVGLLGPNGSGKTTLIKLANGLLIPTEGHIMINGLAPGTATKKIVSYLPDRSYFSEHIKPRAGHVINYLSFFDLGILLGCIFTVLWGGAHFVVANSVSAQPRNLLGVGTLFYIILGAFALWCVLCLLKTYTYTAYQRKELKKYMIMF